MTASVSTAAMVAEPRATAAKESSRLAGLSLAALGIVYGDIGTSPLYAVRESFFGVRPLPVTPEWVLGVLSLTFWSLILVVSVKYLLLMMRADNRGEGGILALLALIDPWHRRARAGSAGLILLAVFGAALLYADAMITPAISVLSAVEGLTVTGHGLEPFVIPLTVAILAVLFAFQKQGTARIGTVFGPIMVVWFVILGGLGAIAIAEHPQVLRAVDPRHGFALFMLDPELAFLVLGGVFLVVTGGEALYADMGHFGRRPIRIAWFGLVLPGLLLNYFGQCAYILDAPQDASHPFYNLVPSWGVYPMIALSTVVTVIASQAVISGTFSLMRQAVQLGQSPPLKVVQTSAREIGQIYVPLANALLFVATVALVLGFGSSSGLAAAYGVAVSGTMTITTLLAYFVMHERWRWPRALALGVAGVLLFGDLAFLGSNLFKISNGGWVSLAVAFAVLLLMTTWRSGRELVHARGRQRSLPIEFFLRSLRADLPTRIPGTAVFLTAPGDNVPNGLLHHLKLNAVLHERVLLTTAITGEVPYVEDAHRVEVAPLELGFYRVLVHYGFMESPDIPAAVESMADAGMLADLEPETTVYYTDRPTLVPRVAANHMAGWRKRLYAFMARNSQRSAEFYRLPPGRSVELGIQLEL